jgi:hypothetical protein
MDARNPNPGVRIGARRPALGGGAMADSGGRGTAAVLPSKLAPCSGGGSSLVARRVGRGPGRRHLSKEKPGRRLPLIVT